MRFVPRALACVMLPCLLGAVSLEAGEPRASEVLTHRVAFVTSTSLTGDLRGLDGADTLCRERAVAAGLSNWSNFRAWLSDDQTDAFCHVQGYSGKRSSNCGLAALPVEAGPWIRTDGSAYAGRIDAMTGPTGMVLNPPSLDEYGRWIDRDERIWANSDDAGVLSTLYRKGCDNWSSADASLSAYSGLVSGTTAGWVREAATCDSSMHLLCLEAGEALPLPPHRSGGALAFVTSTTSGGAIGGLAGADADCQSLASAAGLPAPASFIALLSTTAVDAIDRLTIDGPWIRVDGVMIADSKAQLFESRYSLASALNVDESGGYLSDQDVWTGSDASGLGLSGCPLCPPPSLCSDWEWGGIGLGRVGRANQANKGWISDTDTECWLQARLYCFSNLASVIFVDHFESADPAAWSLSTQ